MNNPTFQRLAQRTLYDLKRRYGQEVTIYKTIGLSTNYQTGIKTSDTESLFVRNCIALPAKLARKLSQSISYLSASKSFAGQGGPGWNQESVVFILDQNDIRDFEPKIEHWITYRGKRYDFHTIEKLQEQLGWLIEGIAVIGTDPEEAVKRNTDDDLIFGDDAEALLNPDLCSLINWETTQDEWPDYQNCINSTLNTSGTDVISQFGSLPGPAKWSSGVLAPNNKIYCSPNRSGTILEIDTNNDTVSEFGSFTSNNNKWAGGVLAQNGKIYFTPQFETTILVVDPDTHITSTIPVPNGNIFAYSGAVIDSAGLMYCVPSFGTDLLVVDTNTDTVVSEETILGPVNILQFIGCTLGPDNNIYAFSIGSDRILKIDRSAPFGSQTSLVGLIQEDQIFQWRNPVLAPNGDIYVVSGVFNFVAKVNFPVGNIEYFGDQQPGQFLNNHSGSALAANGKIYFSTVDNQTGSMSIIDPTLDIITSIPLAQFSSHGDLVSAPNGALYGVPSGSTYVLKIQPASNSSLNSEVLLSGFYNKY